MNNRILNFALALTLLSSDLFAGSSVSAMKNDLSVTVRSLSSQESKRLFGRNLHSERIYPIKLCVENLKKEPVDISIKDLKVKGVNVLTTAKIRAAISAMSAVGFGFALTVVLLPLSFLAHYSIKRLTEQLSMVAQHGFTNDMVTIQPGEVFETFAFPEYKLPETEYLRDASGNRLCDENGKELPGTTPPFVAPTCIDTVVTCAMSTAWFNVSFELSAPV
ncbi:MAG: hypothetical protein IT346_00020 [Epsilonproteobacteria bacterium]|nr:hypothetical protein [Campylobacterota bacterium]